MQYMHIAHVKKINQQQQQNEKRKGLIHTRRVTVKLDCDGVLPLCCHGPENAFIHAHAHCTLTHSLEPNTYFHCFVELCFFSRVRFTSKPNGWLDNKTSVCSKMKTGFIGLSPSFAHSFLLQFFVISSACYSGVHACVCVFVCRALRSSFTGLGRFGLCIRLYCDGHKLRERQRRARSLIICPHTHMHVRTRARASIRLSSQRSSACALCLLSLCARALNLV